MDITMKLPVKIDADNSVSVQDAIDDMILKSGAAAKEINITLDAGDMNYISSAGLRVMLSTKKRVADLTIINASPQVCDIFDVTGFNEFISVNRRVEEIRIEGLKLIGRGATAKVYKLDKDKVVKAFPKEVPYETVLKEQDRIKKAITLGIDTMISYGVVKTEEGYGAIYELLDAKSIMEWIKEDPENTDAYIEKFVDFVKKNHEVDLSGVKVKSIKNSFYDKIDKVTDMGFFTVDEAMTARQIVYSIPDKDTYVHGDCHIGNIMLSKHSNELFFIDMPALSKGNPIFDLAGMAWMSMAGNVLDDDKYEELIGIDKNRLKMAWKKILSLYFETEDKNIIDELDRQYTTLECLDLSMAETYAPGLFTRETLEWLKSEGLKAAKYEF